MRDDKEMHATIMGDKEIQKANEALKRLKECREVVAHRKNEAARNGKRMLAVTIGWDVGVLDGIIKTLENSKH